MDGSRVVVAAAPVDHVPLTLAMEEHFTALSAKGYSRDTVRGRRIALRRFIAWCLARGARTPTAVTWAIVADYQNSLAVHHTRSGAPLTLGTQYGYLEPLKVWFRWLAKEQKIKADPTCEMELPPVPRQIPRALLSVADVQAILTTPNTAIPCGLRDRALLEVLYSTGLRRSEVAKLRMGDVDIAGRLIFVREGKGRRDRMVPFSRGAAAWLSRYLVQRTGASVSQSLFETSRGGPATPAWVASRVRRHINLAGLRKPGSCHLLRHACATHMLNGGADIRFIQSLLGHATLATTERYTHVALAQLQRVHSATHPSAVGSRRTETTDQGSPMGTVPTPPNRLERLSIVFTARQAASVRAAVDGGDYASVSEAVRAAVRFWLRLREGGLAGTDAA